MTRKERAIEIYKAEIDASYKKFMKYSKPELLELAKSSGLYTDNGKYPKSWVAYDLAVRSVTGY